MITNIYHFIIIRYNLVVASIESGDTMNKFSNMLKIILAIIFVILIEIHFLFRCYGFAMAIMIFFLPLLVIVVYILRDLFSYCSKEKRQQKTKIDRITTLIMVGIILVLFARNLLLPQAICRYKQPITFKGEKYKVVNFEDDWYPVDVGRLCGRMVFEEESFLLPLFAVNRIHTVKGDDEHISYLVSHTLSEFGDYALYREDVILPTLDNIEPYKITLGKYYSLTKVDMLKNKMYVSLEDESTIDEILDILRNNKYIPYDYSEADIELLENFVDDDYIDLGLFSEQVPGSVYTIGIMKEDWRYSVYIDSHNTMDVTYMVYRLLMEGERER